MCCFNVRHGAIFDFKPFVLTTDVFRELDTAPSCPVVLVVTRSTAIKKSPAVQESILNHHYYYKETWKTFQDSTTNKVN